MNGLILFGICFITWLAWVPSVLMGKEARGDTGGTSILPIIPLFPLTGWGIGIGLNLIKPKAGLYVIGGLHIVLLAVFLGSVLISAIRIKIKNSQTKHPSAL
jgi:hypothetical protein